MNELMTLVREVDGGLAGVVIVVQGWDNRGSRVARRSCRSLCQDRLWADENGVVLLRAEMSADADPGRKAPPLADLEGLAASYQNQVAALAVIRPCLQRFLL